MGAFEDAINHNWSNTRSSGNIGPEGQGFGIMSSGVLGEPQRPFSERIAEVGEAENIEDRRGEKMSDIELIFRQLDDLANRYIPPYPKKEKVERPAGKLASELGYDDIGGK